MIFVHLLVAGVDVSLAMESCMPCRKGQHSYYCLRHSPSAQGKSEPCSWDDASRNTRAEKSKMSSRVFFPQLFHRNLKVPKSPKDNPTPPHTESLIKGLWTTPWTLSKPLCSWVVAAEASFNTLCWSLSFIVVLQCIAGMARKTQRHLRVVEIEDDIFTIYWCW